ncbi:hypothetical protein SAMN02745823_01973 [Sporobacter termitidis DSM 10068]|uniref:Lipoprotein n=1 Tax=Sporobacter termitidis DSM 10068 TaxID=1123282 RepID=A0A1M5XS78_9FIRM|nr:hypothetical protein [Sporobacter termitidis]SHI02394.1 hypothetical protein SAMN02745823_01973 [Sporobacter termitidis DSM 10068]
MKRMIAAVFFCVILLAGCADTDKVSLVSWMQNLDAEQTKVYFWSMDTQEEETGETELTPEERRKLISILSNLSEDDITWNRRLAGITPEYGFHLVAGDGDRYINQAGAPHGQTEISFEKKQWWIESSELFEFMKSFLEAS